MKVPTKKALRVEIMVHVHQIMVNACAINHLGAAVEAVLHQSVGYPKQ